MGILDSLKRATGLGLNASEHYQRAFEKGVLLGPQRFAEAAGLFDAAAQKANEIGDAQTAARSTANAKLYSYLVAGDPSNLAELRRALDHLDEIEAIGSRTEMMSADGLRAELDGRLMELEIGRMGSADHQRLSEAHIRASEAFKKVPSWSLVTYKHHFKLDDHIDKAQSRFFYHLGLSSWHAALATVLKSPDGAAEHMGRALTAFRQCRDERWASHAQEWLARCRQKRTCWFCHRELQGAGIHFRSFSAIVHPYVTDRIAELGQDASSVDSASGEIVLCQPCGSALEAVSQRIASEKVTAVREELGSQIDALNRSVDELEARIDAVARSR